MGNKNKERFQQFFEWLFDRHTSDLKYPYSNYSDSVRSAILLPIGFIIIVIIILFVIWIDNYITYNF